MTESTGKLQLFTVAEIQPGDMFTIKAVYRVYPSGAGWFRRLLIDFTMWLQNYGQKPCKACEEEDAISSTT